MWIGKVREILEQNDTNAIEFVDDFRSSLFQEEVFTFTPKGDLVTMPNGATALDFAFDIHSQVGSHCLGAKVNQKLVPLNHVLKNGDQVEILTSKKQKPNEDWLKYVVTSKARARIKDALKEEKKHFAAEGKEVVKRKMKQLKIPFSQEVTSQLATFFDVKNVTDLYYLIGKGKIDHNAIKKFKDNTVGQTKKVGRVTDTKAFSNRIRKVRDEDYDLLLIGEDMNVVDYKFAKCCNPIPGDDVFGFVTINDGIKIHRTTCPNAAELLSNYGYRVVKAKWTSSQDNSFLASLRIIGTDRLGLINNVTQVISNELKVNMRSITINTEGGIFEGAIELYVNDTKHLDQLIGNLEGVNGVVSVSRQS
jgi:GTP pyrophosphokinase